MVWYTTSKLATHKLTISPYLCLSNRKHFQWDFDDQINCEEHSALLTPSRTPEPQLFINQPITDPLLALDNDLAQQLKTHLKKKKITGCWQVSHWQWSSRDVFIIVTGALWSGSLRLDRGCLWWINESSPVELTLCYNDNALIIEIPATGLYIIPDTTRISSCLLDDEK